MASCSLSCCLEYMMFIASRTPHHAAAMCDRYRETSSNTQAFPLRLVLTSEDISEPNISGCQSNRGASALGANASSLNIRADSSLKLRGGIEPVFYSEFSGFLHKEATLTFSSKRARQHKCVRSTFNALRLSRPGKPYHPSHHAGRGIAFSAL